MAEVVPPPAPVALSAAATVLDELLILSQKLMLLILKVQTSESEGLLENTIGKKELKHVPSCSKDMLSIWSL